MEGRRFRAVCGRDVINHAGAAALRLLADRTSLTFGLSRALARRGFVPIHDRGRVLTDTAVLIADGGRVLSDLATLRDQGELYGPACGGRMASRGDVMRQDDLDVLLPRDRVQLMITVCVPETTNFVTLGTQTVIMKRGGGGHRG